MSASPKVRVTLCQINTDYFEYSSGKFKTYSVKTLHQLLITQAVVCVKPGIKVLGREEEEN